MEKTQVAMCMLLIHHGLNGPVLATETDRAITMRHAYLPFGGILIAPAPC
jgi:hypothetical protein